MLDVLELDSDDKIKAFTHPYRMKILHVLKELARPATATEVARVLNDGPGKVHYHVRLLEAAGIVALERTETVNGIIARFYQPVARRFRVSGATLGSDADSHLREDVARLITQRFKEGLRVFLDRTTGQASAQAAEHGPGSFLYDLSLYCDDEEWLRLQSAIRDLLEAYRKPAEGRHLRHIFTAGASDFSAASLDRPLAVEPQADPNLVRKTVPLASMDACWTFGVSFMTSATHLRSGLPPL